MPSLLLVEPAAPVAATLRKFLEGDGRQLVTVSTREEALRELRERPPELLVTSLSPAFDGEALCREVKQQLPALPVLMLYLPEEDAPERRAEAAGADACLVGPLKRVPVLTCVQLLLKLGALWRGGSGEDAVQERSRTEELEALPPSLPEPAQGAVADFEFLKRLLLMEVKRSRRYRYPISLLLVELDSFSERAASLTPAQRTVALADTLGMLVGGVRDIDLAVPLTEGRFVVFLPHTGLDGGLVVAERLRLKVKERHPVHGLTASVGMAVFEPSSSRAQEQMQVSFGHLMMEAGEALRRAQAAGGDRVESAQPRTRERIFIG